MDFEKEKGLKMLGKEIKIYFVKTLNNFFRVISVNISLATPVPYLHFPF